MSRLLICRVLLLALLLLPGMSHAADVRLAWVAGSGLATGHRLHYGTASRTYAGTVDVGNVLTGTVDVGNVLTGTVPNLTPGVTYFFAVTAYNATGESAFSNEVSHQIPAPTPLPGVPQGVRVIVTTIVDMPGTP